MFTALCAVVTLLRDLFAQAFPEYSTLQRETGERSSSEEQLWSYTEVGLKPETRAHTTFVILDRLSSVAFL